MNLRELEQQEKEKELKEFRKLMRKLFIRVKKDYGKAFKKLEQE